mgnify:CR=1 FL=1
MLIRSPSSTSAYLVPVMTLLQQGLTPEILLSARDAAAPGSVAAAEAKLALELYRILGQSLKVQL